RAAPLLDDVQVDPIQPQLALGHVGNDTSRGSANASSTNTREKSSRTSKSWRPAPELGGSVLAATGAARGRAPHVQSQANAEAVMSCHEDPHEPADIGLLDETHTETNSGPSQTSAQRVSVSLPYRPPLD